MAQYQMVNMLVLFILFVVVEELHGEYKLPSYIVPCSRSDPKFNECALKHGNDIIPILAKGNKKFHIPCMDPLQITRVNLEASENIKLYLNDVRIVGLKNTTIQSFDFNFDKQTINLELFVSLLNVKGIYNINGHIMILNLKGNGACNHSFYDNQISIHIQYELKDKNNKQYISFKKLKSDIQPRKAELYFDNLLNNPELSTQMNAVLNENWKVLEEELLPSINQVIEDIFLSIVSFPTEKLPYDDVIKP